jgi:hypothetical protein
MAVNGLRQAMRARRTRITGHVTKPVVTNKDGWGDFMSLGGKVSVWLPGQR